MCFRGLHERCSSDKPEYRVICSAPWLHHREIVNNVDGGEASANNLIQAAKRAESSKRACLSGGGHPGQ